jgi:hypothetical protein
MVTLGRDWVRVELSGGTTGPQRSMIADRSRSALPGELDGIKHQFVSGFPDGPQHS